MISEELHTILACPVCKGDLEADSACSVLLCLHCGLKFPVRDGVPIMLTNEAELIP